MVRVERAIRIPTPAAVAWDVLGDFSLREIAQGICTRVEVDRSGVGAVRTMYIAGTWGDGYTGGTEVCVRERLETRDDEERFMSYRLIDAGPLPFADYVGSARIVAAGPEGCIAVMTSAFVPVELDDEAAAALSRGSIDLALANLRAAALRRKDDAQSGSPAASGSCAAPPRSSTARS
jgi:hypothetical protein